MINRRRAPSSSVSSEKKLAGHSYEDEFANIIGGKTVSGTGKADVIGPNEEVYSIKSGKKWQVFLYSYDTIIASKYLNIFSSLQEAYPKDAHKYFQDREKVISYKEKYGEKNGKESLKHLTNQSVSIALGSNIYIKAKEEVQKNVPQICKKLEDKSILFNILKEAIFKNNEVRYLVVMDSHYLKDGKFKIFFKDDILEIFSKYSNVSPSGVGKVSVDFNVPGQKVNINYKKNGKDKNLCHFEMRVSSEKAYRLVLLNMHSQDALRLLTKNLTSFESNHPKVVLFGQARNISF